MTSKSQLILHVATEAFVIASLSIFFTKKINTLTQSIDEMATHMQHITSKLEEQEKMIRMLSDKVVLSEMERRQDIRTPCPSPILTPQPPPPNPPKTVSVKQKSQRVKPRESDEGVILFNLFNSVKQPSQKPFIELMDDELDTEIKAELMELDHDLSPIQEESESEAEEQVEDILLKEETINI
jgi:hypothetical protein